MSASKWAHPKAMVSAAWLAELYEKGWGVAQDYSKAHKCFEIAAADGNTDAMISLGRLYDKVVRYLTTWHSKQKPNYEH